MGKDITKRRSFQWTAEDESKWRRYLRYCRELGQFVDSFSSVEGVIQHALMHHAKVDDDVRRAVFSGVRVNEGIGLLRRLADVGRIDPTEWAGMKRLLDQLSIINDRRNAIIHHGARGVQKGRGFASNEFMALTPDRVKKFPIGAGILRRMSADLTVIYFGLSYRHIGPRWRARPKVKAAIDRMVDVPWRYIPPPPKQNHRPQRVKSAKRRRPPRSSRA